MQGLTDIKDIGIMLLVAGGIFLIYEAITKWIPDLTKEAQQEASKVNSEANNTIANSSKSAESQQEQQIASGNTSPTAQTSVANPQPPPSVSGTTYLDYLDIPTNVIAGSNETIYAYSTNTNAQLSLSITKTSGWSIYYTTGVGSITTASLDTMGLTSGDTYDVYLVDTTDNIGRTGSFVYKSASSNSVSNAVQQIEQGATNVANSVASNTTTTLSEDGSGYTDVYAGYSQPLDTLERWLKGL